MHSTLAPKLMESANRLPAGSPWVVIKDNGFGLREDTMVEKGGSLAVFVQLPYNNTPHAFRIDIRAMNEVGRFIDIDGTLAPATKKKGVWAKNDGAKIRPGEVAGQLAYKRHIEDAKDWQKLYDNEEELAADED
jgi:hypothetical protein